MYLSPKSLGILDFREKRLKTESRMDAQQQQTLTKQYPKRKKETLTQSGPITYINSLMVPLYLDNT